MRTPNNLTALNDLNGLNCLNGWNEIVQLKASFNPSIRQST